MCCAVMWHARHRCVHAQPKEIMRELERSAAGQVHNQIPFASRRSTGQPSISLSIGAFSVGYAKMAHMDKR